MIYTSRTGVMGALWPAAVLASILALSAGSSCLAQLKNDKPDYWSISVAYPRFASEGEVAAKANAASKRAESRDYNTFLQEASRDVPQLRKDGSSATYFLEAWPSVTLDTPTICSGFVEHSEATGGAHTNTTYWVVTYASIGGTVRHLKLADLFQKNVDPVKESSKAITEALKKQQRIPTSVAHGEWQLDAHQASRFAITEAGLLFLFDKAELGTEAEGAIKVVVPFSELPDLDRNGVLKPVIAEGSASQLRILETGRWYLRSIEYNDDKTYTPDGDDSWIEFRDGRVTGKAGLNRFQGSYTAKPDGSLEMGHLSMTRAANPPDSLSSHFESDVSQVSRYMFKDGRLILELPVDVGSMVFHW